MYVTSVGVFDAVPHIVCSGLVWLILRHLNCAHSTTNNYVTDEDSGKEDEINLDNLPPLILNEAELFRNSYSSESDSEDDIPLALLQ